MGRTRRRGDKRVATRGYVKSILNENVESKNRAAFTSPVNGISTTLYALELLDLLVGAQGAGAASFVGNEIRLQNVYMALHLEQANTHPNGDVVRVMIVEPRENYTPSSGNLEGIFFDTGHPLLSTPNYETLKRVVYDRTFILNQPSNNHKELVTKKNYNYRNRLVKFSTVNDGSGGAVNTMDTSLWLIAISDSSVSNSAHPKMDAWFKIRYKDA